MFIWPVSERTTGHGLHVGGSINKKKRQTRRKPGGR